MSKNYKVFSFEGTRVFPFEINIDLNNFSGKNIAVSSLKNCITIAFRVHRQSVSDNICTVNNIRTYVASNAFFWAYIGKIHHLAL